MAKAGEETKAPGVKMVPADCVSVLLMALGNTSISKAQYDMMSALDGTRTASSFEHQFRSITQKAKELKARVDNGEAFTAVAPAKKRGAGGMSTPPATPTGKKAKATPKAPKGRGGKKVQEPVGSPLGGDRPTVRNSASPNLGDKFNEGLEDMIKQEQNWLENE